MCPLGFRGSEQPERIQRMFARLMGYFFGIGVIGFLLAAGGVAYGIHYYSQDLPDYTVLADYEPPVMTRVHASDGSLIAEYARERRLFLPI